MILSPDENKVVASCGWVDHSNLLLIDVKNHKEELIKIGEARYIVLKRASGDYFVAIQCFDGEHIILTIHSFSDPARKLSEIIVNSVHLESKGNAELWNCAPKYYVAYLKDQFQGADYRLIEINPERKDMLFPDLEWFDDSYDKAYQGVIDVIEIPNTDFLLFSVQRSSLAILYDGLSKQVARKIELAGRGGNPIFSFRNKNQELWCIDYDTLVRMNVANFEIISMKQLQEAFSGTMQFAGHFSFTPDEKLCAVARPFSNNIVLLDVDSLEIVSEYKSRFQPLSVVVTSNHEFVSRDWKSGKVEYGAFNRKPRWWSFLK